MHFCHRFSVEHDITINALTSVWTVVKPHHFNLQCPVHVGDKVVSLDMVKHLGVLTESLSENDELVRQAKLYVLKNSHLSKFSAYSQAIRLKSE